MMHILWSEADNSDDGDDAAVADYLLWYENYDTLIELADWISFEDAPTAMRLAAIARRVLNQRGE